MTKHFAHAQDLGLISNTTKNKTYDKSVGEDYGRQHGLMYAFSFLKIIIFRFNDFICMSVINIHMYICAEVLAPLGLEL